MDRITIGKYTLESLTTGMYVDPYVLYREYIQNAADSIDKAVSSNIIRKENSEIRINILKEKQEIIISDNGVGISKDKVYGALLNIGDSEKRVGTNKGFRGIGRLSGLGYCDKIIFETSILGESITSSVTFDSIKLQELLSPEKYEDLTLEDIIIKSSKIEHKEEDKEKHFFKVKLVNVNKKMKLLEFDRVLEYIQETAPVPYNIESFKFGKDINNKLNELNIKIDEYNLFLCTENQEIKVYKPYRSKIIVDLKRKILDEVTNIKMHIIRNDLKDNKLVALVWYGENNLFGTIIEEKIKGFRIRKSGLLIGDRFSANSIFKEERFNGWIIGEIIILDQKIIPNARRDDFEKNDDYLFLYKKLNRIGENISDEIRIASKNRTEQLKVKKNTIKKDSVQKKYSIYEKIDKIVEGIASKEVILRHVEEILIKNKVSQDIIKNIKEDIESL